MGTEQTRQKGQKKKKENSPKEGPTPNPGLRDVCESPRTEIRPGLPVYPMLGRGSLVFPVFEAATGRGSLELSPNVTPGPRLPHDHDDVSVEPSVDLDITE